MPTENYNCFKKGCWPSWNTRQLAVRISLSKINSGSHRKCLRSWEILMCRILILQPSHSHSLKLFWPPRNENILEDVRGYGINVIELRFRSKLFRHPTKWGAIKSNAAKMSFLDFSQFLIPNKAWVQLIKESLTESDHNKMKLSRWQPIKVIIYLKINGRACSCCVRRSIYSTLSTFIFK